MIVQNSELFGIVGYTFALEVGDKVGDAPDPPLLAPQSGGQRI